MYCRHNLTFKIEIIEDPPPSLKTFFFSFTCLKISVMKLTLVLEEVRTLLTTSMSVSCSSSMEQSEEELGSLSVSVEVLEWLCSGSHPDPRLPDSPMLPPPGPDEHPLLSRWPSNRSTPPPQSSELPAERAARPAAARWEGGGGGTQYSKISDFLSYLTVVYISDNLILFNILFTKHHMDLHKKWSLKNNYDLISLEVQQFFVN